MESMGQVVKALIVVGVLAGLVLGACGGWVATKACGYRVRIERVAP